MAKNQSKTAAETEAENAAILAKAAKSTAEAVAKGELRPLDSTPANPYDSSKEFDLPQANAVTVAGAVIGDPDKREDVLHMIGSWMPDMEVVYGGGALPPLFPETPRINDNRVVRFIGYSVVPAEKSGSDNDFVSLNFEVLNPQNGRVLGNAQLPLSAVLFDFFRVVENERKANIGGKEKTLRTYSVGREPSKEILLITYGGETPSKRGMNPAKLWAVEILRARAK